MVLKTEYILGLRISIPLDGSCWSVLVLSELIPVNTRQAQSHRKTEVRDACSTMDTSLLVVT